MPDGFPAFWSDHLLILFCIPRLIIDPCLSFIFVFQLEGFENLNFLSINSLSKLPNHETSLNFTLNLVSFHPQKIRASPLL